MLFQKLKASWLCAHRWPAAGKALVWEEVGSEEGSDPEGSEAAGPSTEPSQHSLKGASKPAGDDVPVLPAAALLPGAGTSAAGSKDAAGTASRVHSTGTSIAGLKDAAGTASRVHSTGTSAAGLKDACKTASRVHSKGLDCSASGTGLPGASSGVADAEDPGGSLAVSHPKQLQPTHCTALAKLPDVVEWLMSALGDDGGAAAGGQSGRGEGRCRAGGRAGAAGKKEVADERPKFLVFAHHK